MPLDSVQVLQRMLDQHSEELTLFRLVIKRIVEPTKVFLVPEVFSWPGVFCIQGKGLSMSCRIAPILAFAFVYDIKAMALCLFKTLYVRYIDDVLAVASSETELLRYVGQLYKK